MSEDLRLVLAGFAAVLVPGVLGVTILAIGDSPDSWLAVLPILAAGCVIAFFHLFLIGLPLWLLVSRFTPIRWWGAGLLGFGVGVLPLTLIFLLPHWLNGNWYDWSGSMRMFLFCGAVGASSGLAFRTVRPGRQMIEVVP